VVGTIYEAIHYAVFSIILLLSAKDWSALFPYKVYSLSSLS